MARFERILHLKEWSKFEKKWKENSLKRNPHLQTELSEYLDWRVNWETQEDCSVSFRKMLEIIERSSPQATKI